MSATDWHTIGRIRGILQMFYDATKACEGRQATLDMVLPIMDFLLEKYEETAETFRDDLFMVVSIEAGAAKLREYFNKTDRATAYVAAIFLNPLRKWAFFEDWNQAWKRNAKFRLKQF